MTKDAPAFDLALVLQTAVELSATHGVKVRVSRAGAITIDPPAGEGDNISAAARRMRRMRERKAVTSDAVTPVTPVTDVTLVTLVTPDVTQSPPPSLPLPQTPSPTLPPTRVTSAHTREKAGLAQKPDDVDQQVWNDFQAQRKAKKAPLTVTALERIRREASKANMTLNDALAEATARGWQGFNADWVKQHQLPLRTGGKPPANAHDILPSWEDSK